MELLYEIILMNTSLYSVEIIKCRLKHIQLIRICEAIVEHQQQCIQDFHLSQLRINKFGGRAISELL